MHLIIDELLTKEQLNSPKKYIYQMCEMYGWEFPPVVVEQENGYRLTYKERSEGKAKKRQRLINDACIRLGTRTVENYIEPAGEYNLINGVETERYYCNAIIPRFVS